MYIYIHTFLHISLHYFRLYNSYIGMVDVFALLPWWGQYPTFRTACTVVMFLTSIVLSYIYIAIAYILSFLSSQIFRKADKIV